MNVFSYFKHINDDGLTFRRLRDAFLVRARYMPHYLSWVLDLGKKRSKAISKLERYRNLHSGERCFVLANGPSLAKVDLETLDGEYTIGMNRIYHKFSPTYLVVMDVDIQIKQFYEDFNELTCHRFFSWLGREFIRDAPRQNFLLPQMFLPEFATDITKGVWSGHSVTSTCLQIAYFMGFSEVILLGKDHSYKEIGKPGQLVESSGKEENHFFKGYYRKGQHWKIPDYTGEELAYKMARRAYESSGRKIVDATIDGKLDVFDKVNLEELLASPQ